MAKTIQYSNMRKFLEFTNATIGGKLHRKLIVPVDARFKNDTNRAAGEKIRKALKAEHVILRGYHGKKIPKHAR